MEIILNDLDPNKDQKLIDFLETDISKEARYLQRPDRPVTDSECEELFTKVATLKSFESFGEYKKAIHSMFDGKLDPQLDRWESKLALDRSRLDGLFSTKKTS